MTSTSDPIIRVAGQGEALYLSESADQQALGRVNERYGVVVVGPPLEEDGL